MVSKEPFASTLRTWRSYWPGPEVTSTPGVQLNTGSAATSAAGPGCEGRPPAPVGAVASNLKAAEAPMPALPAASVPVTWAVRPVPSVVQANGAQPPTGGDSGSVQVGAICRSRYQPAALGVPLSATVTVGGALSTTIGMLTGALTCPSDCTALTLNVCAPSGSGSRPRATRGRPPRSRRPDVASDRLAEVGRRVGSR